MSSKNYDNSFFAAQSNESHISAKSVVPIVYDIFKPKTVIDIGCGVGAWTSVFKNDFSCEVVGMDGDYVNPDQLLIPRENFMSWDLNKTLPKIEKKELAICLEVAEHLSETRANSFIHELTLYSDVVLFSAAIPGQGGTHHYNEQHLKYWISLFEQNDFSCVDCIRPLIWEEKKINWWFRQNMVLFIKNSSEKLTELKARKSFDGRELIIRELYDYRLKQFSRPRLNFSFYRTARQRLSSLKNYLFKTSIENKK